MKIALVYGTREGQTAEVATFLHDVIKTHGHDVEVVDLERSQPQPLDRYDGIIVGASIHMGKHEGYVADFVRRNRAEIEHRPSAFFSVSLAAHGDTVNAERYVEEFGQQTGWRPARVAMFAGALRYREYGFVKRQILKKIARDKGTLSTDTSRDWIYTEWDDVTRFGEQFLSDLASTRTGR